MKTGQDVLTESSRLSQALGLGEGVLDYIVALNPHDFERLRNPLMRKLMPGRIKLGRLAAMVELPLSELLRGIYRAAGLEYPEELLDGTAVRERSRNESYPQSTGSAPNWTRGSIWRTVDLLASDERLDADPARPISLAIKKAGPGQVILIKHKWEPQPLYDVWKKLGLEFFCQKKAADEKWIYVRKTPEKKGHQDVEQCAT